MLDFTIVSELKSFGYTEDGEEFIGEVYFIQAGDDVGNRWNHDYTFPGVKVGYDEEHGVKWFEDTREDAKAAAQALLDRILAAGITFIYGRVHWSLGRPAYGSLAYINYGQRQDWLEDRLAA